MGEPAGAVGTSERPMGRALDSRLTFDSFVVGTANRLVASAARKVVDPRGRFYNPLLVHGQPGTGKTHLLNAIGHYARQSYPHDDVVYDSFELFMERLARASESDRDCLMDRLQETRILLLDDVQFVIDRRNVQDDFGRVWDLVTSQGGQLVLASDRPPSDFEGLHKRLLSRLLGGLVLEIGQPDYDTRLAILRQKAAERNAILDAGVPELLARGDFESVRELQGALNRILVVQELEARLVPAGEVEAIIYGGGAESAPDDGQLPEEGDEQWEFGGPPAQAAPAARHPAPAVDAAVIALPSASPFAANGAVETTFDGGDAVRDAWFLDHEKIVWDWPDPREWIAEALD